MIQNDKIISAEILNKLGIYELRELARSMGIPSPTTKKRKELCEQILKVSTGEKKIEIKKNNKGRPPKSVTKMVSFVNEFVPEDILRVQKQSNDDIEDNNILTFAQNPSINDFKEEKQVIGYINSINNYFYVKNIKVFNEFKDLIFYIPEDIVKKYSLREGDKILADGRMAKTCYCGIIENIIKINNEEVKVYSELKARNSFDLSNYEIPSIKETFLEHEIKKGERILTFFNNQEEAIVKLLEELNKSNEKVIILGLELAPEIIYYIKSKTNIDIEAFTTNFYNSLEDNYNAITNSLNHISTLLKDGKSIKFIIFDIMNILSRLDLYYAKENNCFMGHSISSIQMLKKLIGTGKAFSKDLQVTTISIAFENERNNELIKTELSKIFSKIF